MIAREQLTALNTQALAGFAEVKKHIERNDLPPVIHQRHAKAVEKYNEGYQTLITHLDNVYYFSHI